MCHRRQVCYVYTRCGHAYAMPDEVIPCESTRCKFSPSHPRNCYGEKCKRGCWQYRQPSEQYSPQIAGPCPNCGKHR